MRKPLLRTLFLVTLVAGLVIAPAAIARVTDTGSGTLTPGSNACVGPFYSNGTSIELSGQVTNGSFSPKWSIWWSADNTTFTKKFATHAIGITQDILQSQNPELFPGYFLGCVNNDTPYTVDYTISIGPGQY
ncbi:MAG: hypothetical protein AABO41_12320 [Acidobacteriota bacterium]